MENKSVEVTNQSSEKILPVLRLLFKKSLLIIMVTVLCGLIGLGYGIMKTKPMYTASRSVIFRTEMSDGSINTNIQTNQASLAKIYLPSAAITVRSDAILTPSNTNMIDTINQVIDVNAELTVELERVPTSAEIAERISQIRTLAEKKVVNFPAWRVENIKKIIVGQQNIKMYSGSVGMNYKSTSLIFTLSYTDVSEELASEKLSILVESAAKNLCNSMAASNVTLIDTQHENDISISYNRARFVGISAGAGFLLTVGLILLVYVLDNTIKDKKELEELTGIDVLTVIEKDKKKK